MKGVVFVKKEKKQKKGKPQEVINSKKVIDLTSYIDPQSANSDVLGSYTGTTKEMLETGRYDEPEQDADDL